MNFKIHISDYFKNDEMFVINMKIILLNVINRIMMMMIIIRNELNYLVLFFFSQTDYKIRFLKHIMIDMIMIILYKIVGV
jgi:hypothetical protein